MLNVDDLFRQRVKRQPDHPAILGPGPSRITYAALDEMIESVASGLEQAGVGPAHVSACTFPVESTPSCSRTRCGADVVASFPFPWNWPKTKKSSSAARLPSIMSSLRRSFRLFSSPIAARKKIRLPRSSELVAIPNPRQHPPGFSEINAAFIRFTSGTTGTSKGVVLSHESIRDRIDAANDALKIGPEDRVLWVLSMSYHFTVSIVAYLTFGATIVLPKNHLAAEIIDSIRRHEATLLYASPMHYTWMADSRDTLPLTSLRLAVSTAMALDRDAAKKFGERFGVPVAQALGVIEVGLPAINFDFATDRPEGVGRILPAFRLQLGDVGLGPTIGEVLLSGKGFLDAYYEPFRTRRNHA